MRKTRVPAGAREPAADARGGDREAAGGAHRGRAPFCPLHRADRRHRSNPRRDRAGTRARVIYVDSNVPMYLVGADHPNKTRTIELVAQLLSARERLITSAETFQEILHRYLAIGDRRHLDAAYEA